MDQLLEQVKVFVTWIGVLLDGDSTHQQQVDACCSLNQCINFFELNKLPTSISAEKFINNLFAGALVADTYYCDRIMNCALQNEFPQKMQQEIDRIKENLIENIDDYEFLRVCENCDSLMITGLCTEDANTFCEEKCAKDSLIDDLQVYLDDDYIFYTNWL